MQLRRSASLAVLAAATLSAATTASASARTCDDSRGRTIGAVDSSAGAATPMRVFVRETRSKSDPDAGTRRLYSCVPSGASGVTIKRLETWKFNLDGGSTVSGIAFADRYIALAISNYTGVAENHSYALYNPRTGRRLVESSVDDGGSPEIYATAGGAIAYVADPGVLTVIDGAGQRTLTAPATSEATNPADIATAGNRLYWTLGDAPFSTALSGRARLAS